MIIMLKKDSGRSSDDLRFSVFVILTILHY
jgi:hypothetical protein